MPENERSETPPSAIIKPLALILVPTRELCLQVYEYGRKFADGNFGFISILKFYFRFGNQSVQDLWRIFDGA